MILSPMWISVGIDERSGTLIYVHGFNSSSRSHKAECVRNFLLHRNNAPQFWCPDLPVSPVAAITLLTAYIQQHAVCGVIGSSLGGYYATYLAHHFNVPSALINPAVRPFELLEQYLGPTCNPYTGERYVVTREHLAELAQLYVPQPPAGRVRAWLQTDDEVLDYQQAVDYFGREHCVISSGGGHAFHNYASVIPDQLAFLRI